MDSIFYLPFSITGLMGGENLSSKKHLMARANLEEEEQERKSQKEKKEEGKKREWL